MASDDPNSSAHGDTPVTIRRYVSGFDASVDATALQSHGINARVVGSEAGDGLGFGMAVRKAELVVPSRQSEQAARILKEIATTVSDGRLMDWKCSSCGEINGRQFDQCWSCGKEWSSADAEYEPEHMAQPLPSVDAPPVVLPAFDRNPYAPPVIGTTVLAAPGEAAEEAIRRTVRGAVLGLFFPPILLFAVFTGLNGLSQSSTGKWSASRAQFRKLLFVTLTAAMELLVYTGVFLSLRWF